MNSFIKKIYVMAAALLLSFAIYPTKSNASAMTIQNIESDDTVVNILKGVLFEDLTGGNAENLQNITDENPKTRGMIPTRNQGGELGISYKLDVPTRIKGYMMIRSNTTGIIYFIDNNSNEFNYYTGASSTDGKLMEIDLENIVEIKITNSTNNYLFVNEFRVYGKIIDHYPAYDLIAENIEETSATIKWKLPKDDDIREIIFKKNNETIDTLNPSETSYKLNDLKDGKKYKIEVLLRYEDGGLSDATVLNFETKKKPEKVEDITELKAESEYNRVDLSWKLPSYSTFNHVNIYRDEIKSENFLQKIIGLKSVDAATNAATKIFETNGTYFNDLTVAAQSKYEYILTTSSTTGKESKGIKTIVTTPKKPNPDPPKSEIEKQENGDYLVTWTSPTEGKVLIKIDGKDYVTVNASTGSYLIPEKDMRYSFLGNPLVQIIAIDSDGDESSSSKPGPPGSTENGGSGSGSGSGGGGGFGEIEGIKAKDVLSGTMSFIKLLGPFIILGLIIYLLPRLIIVIKQSLNKNRNYNR